MRIHFIAIGGAIMHYLAIQVHKKGHHVTGSDDAIFDPSRSNLSQYNLLPDQMGFFPEKITPDIHLVVLGMHARPDNPELAKAKELNLRIMSFPDYIFELSKNKTRVVVAGSHGKTSITGMIMHALKRQNFLFDFLVGAKIPGFDSGVSIEENTEIIILEGDEYFASALEPKPKFLSYKPHIVIISGIAWDHINVFPTFELYLTAFSDFMQSMEPGSHLIYCENDLHLSQLVTDFGSHLTLHPYSKPNIKKQQNQFVVVDQNEQSFPLQIIGEHNFQNLEAAKLVCSLLGVSNSDYYSSMSDFSGAANRLSIWLNQANHKVYRDFAHSPSKLKATTEAVATAWPENKLCACMELHTFSSLNKDFLQQYAHTMDAADTAIVLYSPEVLKQKQTPSKTTKITTI